MRRFYSSGSQKHTTPPSCNHAQARKLVDLIDVPGCLDKGNYIQKQIRIEPDSCLHTFRSSKLNAARKNPRNMCTRRFYSAGSQKHTTPPPFDPKQWQYLDSHVTGDELPQQIKLDDPTKHAQARRLINLVDIPGCLNKKGKYIQKQIWIGTDSCLHTLRSVPLLVRSCHLQGKCLSNLSMDTTFINSDGEFELNLDVIEFKEFNKQNVAADWNQASHLTKQYLRSGKGMTGKQITYPADLRCWFKLMQSSRSPYNEYLICTHTSLLPLGNKGAAYLRMFDGLYHSDPLARITQFAYVSMPKNGWQNSVGQNYFLMHWLQFRKYRHAKGAYLVFFRNVLSHIRDHFGLKKLIDFLIYANSPTLLCEMQLALWNTGLLGDMGLEELFPDKYVRRLKFWHKLFLKDSKK